MITLLGFLVAWASTCGAIVIRHDQPDSSYLALARGLPEPVQLFHVDPDADTDEASDSDSPDDGLPDGGLPAGGLPAGAGALVTPEWVLTAASVAYEIELGDPVHAGGEIRAVLEIHPHPGWVGGANDVALVRLDAPVGALPVPIYRGDDEVDASITIAGVGETGNGLTGPVSRDGRLRAARNLVDSASERWLRCRFDHPDAALEREGASAAGDRGGPALLDVDGTWLIAGIISEPNQRPTGNRPGRYGNIEQLTRVSRYQSWIDELLASRGGSGP